MLLTLQAKICPVTSMLRLQPYYSEVKLYLRFASVFSSSVPHWKPGDFVVVVAAAAVDADVELVATWLLTTFAVVAVYLPGSAGIGFEKSAAFATLGSSAHGPMKQVTDVALWAAAVAE